LVLIDGVEANNPISPNRAFNFADLSTENVERIEIVRGAQSTIWGSDAMGGVINIITKRGRGAISGEASFEGGSYQTFAERAALGGGDEKFDYSIGAARIDSGGISAADARDGNTEHDRYGASTFSLRAGATPADMVELDGSLRYETARSDIDNLGGVGGDDPNRIVNNDNLFTRGQAALRFLDGRLEQIWGIGYSDQRFEDNNDPDADHPNDRLRSDYDGNRLKFDLQHNLSIGETGKLVLGLETEEEEGSSSYRSLSDFGPYDAFLGERSARTSGAFSQVSLDFVEGFRSDFGVRVDEHEEFGSEVTWRIAPVFIVSETGTKLGSTVGTGYKAPSLFQLYSEYGFAELEPEKSLSIDATVEQRIAEGLSVGVTWYRNDFDNLITFDPNTYIFANIADATTSGVETFAAFELGEGISTRFSYTYLDSRDDSTGDQLLRRARHKAAVDLAFSPVDRLTAAVGGVFVGVREDNDFSTFPASRTELASYLLINIAVDYAVTEGVKLFARIDNLFDREYQEVLGYGTLGAAGYGGIKVAL
jgi:vitamin B12 transporter